MNPNESTVTPDTSGDDPYLWLEDVGGAAPLEWVEAQNATTRAALQAGLEYQSLFDRMLAIYDSKARIAHVEKIGPWYYNFWRDDQHVRGIWRRTSLDEYRKPEPHWDIVLDLDALAVREDENWVWGGASCLYPARTRALIALSRGGGDAHVVREFDLMTRTFVADGFILPESKGGLAWIDADRVYVETDFGPGSMTDSGYPRIVKEWRRGTPLTDAVTVFEGESDDVSVSAWRSHDHVDGRIVWRDWVSRGITFYSGEHYLRQDGELLRLDVPDDAEVSSFQDQILVTLRSDWQIGAATWPQGALLGMDFERFLHGGRDFEVLFEPGARKSLAGLSETKNFLLVNELDNVRHRLFALRRLDGVWQRREVSVPDNGPVEAHGVDADESDEYFLIVNSPVTPTTLYLADAAGDRHTPAVLKSLPAFFDAGGVTVTRHEAISKDGTRVPYVQISPPGHVDDGTSPTVLYGYGGFEIAILPQGYSAIMGTAWLRQGGVYVLAGIRGGGEFGPAWHQAALKEHRQRAYDDFIAVAEDLIARKVTSPPHLGIEGGSNGGLLVGAVMVQRPELFGAVVCQVPLLDMRRFNTLLAGASWMGEYGNPDDPQEWAWISTYSPYQNVKPGVRYPRVLFTTSTRDDRVHPGHARKMVARMQAQGHDVLYFENTEGGHAGAANNVQSATLAALEYGFLLDTLR